MEIFEKLGNWYEKEKRDLPWRSTSDPYRIWLSEVILQQTRVAQGTDYYLRFLEKFPDIFSLAEAETDEVLKIWQGLGYYSRARNLHETARNIAFERNGKFPDSYTGLLKLKGVGEYTAAAISSIVYKEAVAAIDGNVKRVISRLFSVKEEINSPEGKKIIASLANQILDRNNPGRHNQAVMELGANICLPARPRCIECPLNTVCQSLKESTVAEYPQIYKKARPKNRYFNYLIIISGDSIRLQQRKAGNIWEGLYEFPLIETAEATPLSDFPLLISEYLKSGKSSFVINKISEPVIHKLSHLTIITRFLHLSFPGDNEPDSLPGIKLNISRFDDYPVSRLIDRYIKQNGF